MSFADAAEVLTEFTEAAAVGLSHTHVRRRWWWDARPAATPMPVRPVFRLRSVAIEPLRCVTCGAPCERREGAPRIIHLGPATRCPKKAA